MMSSKICVSLAERTADECVAALKCVDFAEVRLDSMSVTADDVAHIFSSHSALIATCRPGGRTDAERKELLIAAIEAGAKFVDVELESDEQYRNAIVTLARARGCRVIVSFHDYEKTPERQALERLVSSCFQSGADIAKIACVVQSQRDAARLLSLLDTARHVVVAGMGKHGRAMRLIAPLLGSPFTYASFAPGKETADGQIDRETLEELLQVLTARTG